MNDYEDIYHLIRKRGYVAWLVVEPSGEVLGIDVDAPGIDAFDRTGIVQGIVGKDYKTVFLPNEGIIKVTIKSVTHE